MSLKISQGAFKLLFVDDSEVQRQLASRSLTRLFKDQQIPLKLVEAEDGLRAWKTCEGSANFDYYVIDYQMPHMNGVELCRRILKQGCESPILLYTSDQVDVIQKEEGLIDGKPIDEVVDVLPKDIFRLIKVIETYLKRDTVIRKFKPETET